MGLQAQLQNDTTAALKNKDTERRNALSFILSEIKSSAKNKKVDELSDAEIINLLQKQSKQRNETLVEAQKGQRQEMAEKMQYEISLINEYLPRFLGEEETVNLANSVVKDLNASSMRDMGKVMAECTAREAGVDKALLSKTVKELLS